MKLFCAALLSLVAAHALADNDSGYYAGVGYSIINTNDQNDYDDGRDYDVALSGIELIGGWKMSTPLGFEARIGVGSNTEDLGGGLDVGIDHYESLYYRPEKANDVAKLYGLFGLTHIALDEELGNSSSETGFSYGIGVGFVLDQFFNLNIEYRSYISKANFDFDGISINVDYRF